MKFTSPAAMEVDNFQHSQWRKFCQYDISIAVSYSHGNMLIIFVSHVHKPYHDIDGLVQDCSNSSALAMELLQSCAKPTCTVLFCH